MPTIGVQPFPPIGVSTSIIGTGTIGTPTTAVGSTIGALGQTSVGSVGSLGPDLSCLPEDVICEGVVRP
jgi:hypothetical protein